MKSVRSILTALLAVLTGALLVVFTPGSATAAPTGATFTAARATMGPMGVQDTIVCSIFVDNPHNSTHVPGTVNVVARVVCTAPVSTINGIVGLYRDGALVSHRASQNSGVASLTMNTATPCVNGTYDAAAIADIYFPAGYVPPVGRIGNRSNVVPITC